MEYLVSNEQDMRDLATNILNRLTRDRSKYDSATILALSGDLGSGKTTFTKMLASELGIQEHITSPTFVIQKSYQIKNIERPNLLMFRKLVHIDAYRLESGADMDVLEFRKTVENKENLVIIEWAENIKDALTKRALNIKFEYVDGTTRKITIDGTIGAND